MPLTKRRERSLWHRSRRKIPPPETGLWRYRLIAGLCCIAALLLLARLVELQVYRRHEFDSRANRQRTIREPVPARPGDLLDRHGRLLATTIVQRSLYLVPAEIEAPAVYAEQLAPCLGIESAPLAQRIQEYREKRFLWVRRLLTPEQLTSLRQLQLPPGTWGLREEFSRRYPQDHLAAQVIGLRNIDGVGKGGIEQQFDAELRGKAGWRELVLDARGRVIDIGQETTTPARPGLDVQLTLDTIVQLWTEQTLDQVQAKWKPLSCCAVVLDPQTGDVLAMASRPTFNPNDPQAVPDAAWKNRVIADIYEPGSTFKPCVVAWAMQQGLLQQDEHFDCEQGEYRMGSRILHDHHPYGDLSLSDVLAKSSNIGMAKIGQRLKNDGLFTAANVFGFGRRTGIQLPGELAGIVRPLKEWNGYSTGSVPMGQEIASTPLQIIAAYTPLAQHGQFLAPRIVLRTGRSAPAAPRLTSPLLRSEVADWVVRDALTAVMERGTGKKAQVAGYTVFGKSGTAQKLDPETGKYSLKHHISSFICGAPADNPRVLVLVSVDDPSEDQEQFGGTVAGPAAAEILEKTLRHLEVPPDRSSLARRADSTKSRR